MVVSFVSKYVSEMKMRNVTDLPNGCEKRLVSRWDHSWMGSHHRHLVV